MERQVGRQILIPSIIEIEEVKNSSWGTTRAYRIDWEEFDHLKDRREKNE